MRSLWHIPFRYYVMLMTATSAAFMFASRCVINFAILAMTNSESPDLTNSSNANGSISIVPIPGKSAPTFDWNQDQEGVIIGAYFYSYTAMQISTGLLADKFNVVKFNALAHLMATLATLAIPWAAQTNYYLLILVRIILGFAHSPIFSTLFVLMENWFTPQEKALAQAVLTVGTNVGVMFVMPVTAWLCENGFAGGWPSAFYSMAIAYVIFICIWYFTVTTDPASNPFISEDEKNFITSHVVQIPKRNVLVPWKTMFMSLPLWAVTISKGCLSLGYQAVNSKIPLYFETVLKFPLTGNGLVNAALYIGECTGQLISGPLTKFVATKGYLTSTTTRKLSEGFALIGTALFLISIPFLSSQPEIIVFGLIMAMFAMGFSSGGDIPIVPEMAPGLVGTVFGFANTISCAAGFLAPMSIGFILGDEIYSESKWNVSFYFLGGVQLLGAIMFTFFATSEPQSWALVENTTKPKKSLDLVQMKPV